MKVALLLLACVAYVAASGYIYPKPKETKYADKAFLEKQKFLFEIVYRLEDPLFFEEYIQYGAHLIYDKSHYSQFDDYMYKFYEAYKYGALLPKGEYFSALVKTHIQQVYGLFKYFYYAKDYETFMQNVCWARIHVNEGMFFYALNLAVIHRPDFQGFILPAVYEVFPQYFYNYKFIYQAEKFDYDVWSKYALYEKEFKDVYYKDAKDIYGNYYYQHDWKTWQWWKMMGLDEHFYYEDKYNLRENYEYFFKDAVHADFFKQFKSFYMPVDYTRDVDFYNYHNDLSYFTEDIGWNSYWYYLNLDYPVFFEGKTYGLNKDRRGEYYIYNVQQLLARYYLERLSHGYGAIEDFSFYNYVQTGYDPHLITYNGVAYSYRPNYYYVYSYDNYGNYEMYQRLIDTFSRIYDIIDTGYYKTYDGTVIDLRKPESYEYIGNLLQGNYDVFDKHFFTYWTVFAHMYFGEVDYTDKYVYPNVFLNYETMMRDPFFYMFYKKVADVFYRFTYHLGAYTQKDLYFEGVKIEDVKVDKLVTYFDFYDADVTNLLNDKPTFADGKFVWDQQLLARQLRLNHKPFSYEIAINSDKAYKAVVKAFIAPKYDEYGQTIPLYENYQNFFEFDEFYYQLAPGKNVIKRNSYDFYWTVKDKTTYTELYYYVMYAYEGKYKFPYDIVEPHNGFPDRLILPYGSPEGFPYQFFFFVYPYSAQYEQFSNYDYSYYHGVGTGTRYIDNKPFAYPFDRPVDEFAYYVPNMYFKDVKIYHEEQYEKYYENYENYGQFDYNYYHY